MQLLRKLIQLCSRGNVMRLLHFRYGCHGDSTSVKMAFIESKRADDINVDEDDPTAGVIDFIKGCADMHQDVERRTRPMSIRPKSFLGWSSAQGSAVSMQRNGIWYYRIERDGLYFVATSKSRSTDQFSSAFAAIEILSKLYEVCRDLCGGTISEDSIRSNAALVNELLLEFMDQGVVQLCSAEKLKPHIYSEPVRSTIKTANRSTSTTAGRSSSQMSKSTIFGVSSADVVTKNEVFLDVVERLSVTASKDGTVLRSDVDGRLLVKCLMRCSPLIKLALNEDLAVDVCTSCSETGDLIQVSLSGGNVRLDSCRFHETVSLQHFGCRRTLTLTPPTFRELTLMTYRMGSRRLATLPFRLHHTISAVHHSTDLDVELVLKCQVPAPASALYVTGRLGVPRTTTSLMSRLSGRGGAGGVAQTTHFDVATSSISWRIKGFEGGTEVMARLRLVDGNLNPEASELEVGPLALEFELSTHACSGLLVRSLDIVPADIEHHGRSTGASSVHGLVEPARWVRYISHSNSYIFRLH